MSRVFYVDSMNLLLRKLGYLRPLADIKHHRVRLVLAVLTDKLVQPVLAPTNDGDFGARLNKALGHGVADTGRCTDDQDVFVGECHDL